MCVVLSALSRLYLLEYRFYDREGTEIDLKEEIEIK